jgi:hypothetical protein
LRWSVTIHADGDRVLTREEVVELAGAVAASNGIASGIGTTSYGVQIVVVAETPEQAIAMGATEFVRAAAAAGLPNWPVAGVTAISEEEDDVEYLG